MGKLLVVMAAATAALTLPATAALADHGHHDRFRHAHGHHVVWFRPHCPPVIARPASPGT